MLEFAHPWVSLFLPLPFIIHRFAPPHYEAVSAMRTPFIHFIANITGQIPREGSVILKRHLIQLSTAVLVWVLLLLALAKPELLSEPITRTDAGRDVMLAIDISGSMDERDYVVPGEDNLSRLDVVKRVVGEFIEARKGDRIGLIIFGSKAYVQVPFTQDLQTARALLDAIEVGMAGPHTVIGDAIGLAIRTFEVSELDQRLLIILSDGEDTGSRMTPVNAAAIAAQHKVQIFTVGIGDPEGSAEGRVDFDGLAQISNLAGGHFFRADDHEGLVSVYAEIDKMVARETRTVSYRPRQSLVHWPMSAALLVMIMGLASMLLTHQLPKYHPHSDAGADA